MRKLLVALMMVAFAATAFAADVKFSGTYEVDGKMEKNYGMDSTDVATNSYYEHDMDLWMKVAVDKDTFFNTKIELLDETWGSAAVEEGTYTETSMRIERAWMGHNFGSVLVEAGVMNGGGWSYDFGNDVEGKYRLKATFNVAGGKLGVFTQKNAEKGVSGAVKDAEKDDNDAYSINYVGKFGGITIAPNFVYTINSAVVNHDFAGTDSKTMDFDLALGAKFGAIEVQAEGELVKKAYDTEDATHQDSSVYGWMVNVSSKLGAATVGFFSAYGSVDKDADVAYDFNDDFETCFILGDDIALGGAGYVNQVGGDAEDLMGFWANAVYATYDVNDKLGLMAKLAYAKSNYENDDTKAYELDASANYAITKELNYYVNFGYAKVDFDGGTDPDAIVLVKHGLVLNF